MIFTSAEATVGMNGKLEVDSFRNGKPSQVFQVRLHVFPPTYAKDQSGSSIDHPLHTVE